MQFMLSITRAIVVVVLAIVSGLILTGLFFSASIIASLGLFALGILQLLYKASAMMDRAKTDSSIVED